MLAAAAALAIMVAFVCLEVVDGDSADELLPNVYDRAEELAGIVLAFKRNRDEDDPEGIGRKRRRYPTLR